MDNIYTIGFTKKSAEKFFLLLKENKINVLLDVRLNNTSQLAGFSKYPDIEFFLNKICNIDYIWDKQLAPEDWLLKSYKKKEISWKEYVECFKQIMSERGIEKHLLDKYECIKNKRICLLCSEDKADNCHRSLVAQYFSKCFHYNVINL